jgi:predicted HD phosphohydrolase
MKTVSFTCMSEGTSEDYKLLLSLEEKFVKGLPNRILSALEGLKLSFEGYPITRYEHSLQSATRAHRNGESEEIVVAALLHDLGDTLAPHNHGELAAAILKPYVSIKTHWIVKHHGLFQLYYWVHHVGGNRYSRDKYRNHPFYQATIDFCEKYDQNSFDPNYDSLPIDFFEPMVQRIFSKLPDF